MAAHRCAAASLLPGCHLTRREQAQRTSLSDVFQGHPKSIDTPGTGSPSEVVNRKERVFQARDERQDKGRQDLIVRTAGTEHLRQNQPVNSPEMVVGNGDESSRLGNQVQLFRRDIQPDVHFLQDRFGKCRSFLSVNFPVDLIQPMETQDTHETERRTSTPYASESEQVRKFAGRHQIFSHKLYRK